MANFETIHALQDLDRQTPEYFRQEMWAHGDLTTVRVARQILHSGLDAGARTGFTLRSLLCVVPEEEIPEENTQEGKSAG